jgi:hypothetical protein
MIAGVFESGTDHSGESGYNLGQKKSINIRLNHSVLVRNLKRF